MQIDPFAALGEYLALQLGVSAPVSLVLRNRAFRQLMEAAPGWRELITLGKVWHLEQMQLSPGRARWDLIVVDAPATGHGVTFLSAPRVVVSALRTGPLRRQAAQVEALIEDPVRTALLPVSLAEELPVHETEQLIHNVKREVGIRVDRVIVNAVLPRPFPAGLDDLDERLARLPEGAPLGVLPSPQVLAACAAHLRARSALHEHWAQALEKSVGLPCPRLPYLAEGIEGPASLNELGAALLAGEAREAA
jgi:anion-transporting  ArsA/GET3 family ATPase